MSSRPDTERLSLGRLLVGFLLLALAVLVVFSPATRGEFVYDDIQIIAQNQQITKFANIPGLFLQSYWDFANETAPEVSYYRPLTMSLFTVAHVLGGGEPEVFHWFSLVIYAAACMAGWRLAARLLRNEGAGFLAALLFAVHPVHVESVAWISSLHDPLFAFFGFLSLCRLLDWIDGDSKGLPWAAAGYWALSLLSKDAALAILPMALVINLYRRDETEAGRAWGRVLAPMALVALAYVGLRVVAFDSAWAGFDHQTTDFGVGWGRLALLRVELIGGALGLFAWPAELNLFRPFKPALPLDSPEFLWGVAGSLALLVVLGVSWLRRSRTALCLALLIPVSILPIILRVGLLGSFPLSERYLFIPVLAFTSLVVYGLWQRLPRNLVVGLSLALSVGLGMRSLTRLPAWSNELAMFSTGLVQNPRHPMLYWSLGRVKLAEYRSTGNPELLDSARVLYERGMDLLEEAKIAIDGGSDTDIFSTFDDHLQMNLGLGWCLMFEAETDGFHDYASVRTLFERVINSRPDNEHGHIGLGVAWLAEGNPNEAGVALRKALKLNPFSAEAHRNMGVLYMRIEEWAEAAKEFRRCTELRDRLSDKVFLARALFEAGDLNGAERAAQEAHSSNEEDPDPMVLIGQVAEKSKRYGEAISWLNRAVAVAPQHGVAHMHRGKVLAMMDGKNKEAVEALMLACQLLPRSFAAHYDLAVLLLASSNPDTALPYFLVAYATRPAEFDSKMKRAAAAIHRDDPQTLGALANIDIDRGDLFSGRNWIDQALALAPKNPAINFTHGMLLMKEKKPEEATDPLVLAATALEGSYTAQMEASNALLGSGREIEAKAFLTRAVQLLADEPMEQAVKDLTRAQIEKALARIVEMESLVGPVLPGDQG